MDGQTAWHVAGGRRHSSSWRWGLLDTIEHMAAWRLKDVYELVETSRSEIHRKSETAEEVKKELLGSSIRRRWSRTKNAKKNN